MGEEVVGTTPCIPGHPDPLTQFREPAEFRPHRLKRQGNAMPSCCATIRITQFRSGEVGSTSPPPIIFPEGWDPPAFIEEVEESPSPTGLAELNHRRGFGKDGADGDAGGESRVAGAGWIERKISRGRTKTLPGPYSPAGIQGPGRSAAAMRPGTPSPVPAGEPLIVPAGFPVFRVLFRTFPGIKGKVVQPGILQALPYQFSLRGLHPGEPHTLRRRIHPTGNWEYRFRSREESCLAWKKEKNPSPSRTLFSG